MLQVCVKDNQAAIPRVWVRERAYHFPVLCREVGRRQSSLLRQPSAGYACSTTTFCLLRICPTFLVMVDITLEDGLVYGAKLEARGRAAVEML